MYLSRPSTCQEATASPPSTATTNVKRPTARRPKRGSERSRSAWQGTKVSKNHGANAPIVVAPGRGNEKVTSCRTAARTIVKGTARAGTGTSRPRVVTPTDQTNVPTNAPPSRGGTLIGRTVTIGALRPGRSFADRMPPAPEATDEVSQSPIKRKILTPRKVLDSSSSANVGATKKSPAKAHSPSSVFRRPPPAPEVASGRPRPGGHTDLLCSSDDDSGDDSDETAARPLPEFVMEEGGCLDVPPFDEWMLLDDDGVCETFARGSSGVEEEFTNMVLA